MLRLGGRRLAPALRRTALCQSNSTALYHSEHAGGGHTRTGQGLAAEVLPGIATARTPERTAELEALAEKHKVDLERILDSAKDCRVQDVDTLEL